jgi:hypothetical protein
MLSSRNSRSNDAPADGPGPLPPFELAPDATDENVRLLYEKTYDVVATFLDWRHKIMTLGFGVIAGSVALDEWLYTHDTPHWVLAAPLLVSAAFSVVVRRFDGRNEAILKAAYLAGAALEQRLGAKNGGILFRIPASRGLSRTYHDTIRQVFWMASVLFVTAAVGSIVWAIVAA